MRDAQVRRVLTYLVHRSDCSQRMLAKDLGMALGLTNGILRTLMKGGFIERSRRIDGNAVKATYVVTSLGRAEEERLSRAHLQDLVSAYASAKAQIKHLVDRLVRTSDNGSALRVVLYGSRDVAEIGCLCLQATTLQPVAIVDEHSLARAPGRVMDVPVYVPDDVRGLEVGGLRFDRLAVLSFQEPSETHAWLNARGVPPDRVHWILNTAHPPLV